MSSFGTFVILEEEEKDIERFVNTKEVLYKLNLNDIALYDISHFRRALRAIDPDDRCLGSVKLGLNTTPHYGRQHSTTFAKSSPSFHIESSLRSIMNEIV